MKKVFSLLLVVAMLVSLSVVASAATANAAGGMHTVITETDTDITVEVYIANTVNCNGYTSYLKTTAVTFVDGSAVAGPLFDGGTLAPTTNKSGYIKFVGGWTDTSKYITNSGSFLALSYKVAKVDDAAELSEADFAYGTGTLDVSKVNFATGGSAAGVTTASNMTSKKSPELFTIEYVDARTPIVEEPEFTGAVAGTTITCAGKLTAEQMADVYGVEFTAESTVEGARAQKYYGARPGDIVSDGADGTQEFVFGAWDGTFEIVLEGVHAGAKEFKFFVGDAYVSDAIVLNVAE